MTRQGQGTYALRKTYPECEPSTMNTLSEQTYDSSNATKAVDTNLEVSV